MYLVRSLSRLNSLRGVLVDSFLGKLLRCTYIGGETSLSRAVSPPLLHIVFFVTLRCVVFSPQALRTTCEAELSRVRPEEGAVSGGSVRERLALAFRREKARCFYVVDSNHAEACMHPQLTGQQYLFSLSLVCVLFSYHVRCILSVTQSLVFVCTQLVPFREASS